MSPALQPEIDNLTTTMHQLEIMCVIVNIFIKILGLKYTKRLLVVGSYGGVYGGIYIFIFFSKIA